MAELLSKAWAGQSEEKTNIFDNYDPHLPLAQPVAVKLGGPWPFLLQRSSASARQASLRPGLDTPTNNRMIGRNNWVQERRLGGRQWLCKRINDYIDVHVPRNLD